MEELNRKRRILKILTIVVDSENEDSSSDEEIGVISVMKKKSNVDALLLSMSILQQEKRVRILNYIEKVVPNYTDEDFKMHFRLNRQIFTFLYERFEHHDLYKQLRLDKKFPPSKYLPILLWFAGHEGCSFRDLADRFNTSLSCISGIIYRVTMFISSLSSQVISWPSLQRMQNTSDYFEVKYGISKVIGAIDGTHIRIDSPKSGANDYINRKIFTSICLQVICNEKKKFIDIFVGYPGSVHDSRVFRNSFIFPQIENLCKDYYILDDSAYPLMKNVLTSYRDNGHLTSAQKHCNRKYSSCRVIIEHAFGILKQRFRQLYYCKLKGPKKLCHFIRACCVLHNLANEKDFNFEEENEDDSETLNDERRELNSPAAKLCEI